MKRAIGEVSADTTAIERALAALVVDEEIPYGALSDLIGKDVRTDGKGYLRSARQRLLRDQNMVFDCVPSKGIKRLNDVMIVAKAKDSTERIRRASKRGLRVVLAVENFSGLPPHLQRQHNSLALVLGLVHATTGNRGQRKLSAKLANVKPLTEQEVRAIAESI